jgi:hypothetical protein
MALATGSRAEVFAAAVYYVDFVSGGVPKARVYPQSLN